MRGPRAFVLDDDRHMEPTCTGAPQEDEDRRWRVGFKLDAPAQ